MLDFFKKENSFDKYGYCIHLPTGKILGDMCEICCDDREEQWTYKFWIIIFKLPFGHRLYRYFKIK